MQRSFVILFHTGLGAAHYDFMLEDGPGLATWQLAEMPGGLSVGGRLAARRLSDHRRAYLAYEGAVSGGRGQVKCADAGTFDLLSAEEGHWEVRLRGSKTEGRFELRRAGAEADGWELRRLNEGEGSP